MFDSNSAKNNGNRNWPGFHDKGQYGTIPILRQQKDWVGGTRKRPDLLTFSTVFMLISWVGGVQKVQKYTDVI